MSTRKIKDAKDLSTNELIYFKGHAQATYLSDGRTVEEAVNSISGGSGEDSDIFILDLFGVAGGYPDVDDITNTGVIEFDVDSELMSIIDNAIQKNKLVIRVDYVDLYNLEIDAYNSTRYLMINSHFEYGGSYVHLCMRISPSELHGSFSISPVNTGSSSGGGIGSTIANYGTCSTTAATIAKTTSITGFNLVTGARVSVNFTNGNTATSMTLNVNSTGAKSVIYRGSTNTPTLDAGTYDFIYTGSQWELLTSKSNNRFTINRASINAAVLHNTFIRFYYSTGVTSLNVSSTTTADPLYEYAFSFNSGSTPTAFTYPSTWKWANGNTPTINANKTYHVSVIDNCAVIAEF